MFTGISALFETHRSHQPESGPFPSSWSFPATKRVSANDPRPGCGNTSLGFAREAQTARRRKTALPQHPVKSTLTPIIDSFACPSDRQARHLSENEPLNNLPPRGFGRGGRPGTNQSQGRQNAQVYANLAFLLIPAESRKCIAIAAGPTIAGCVWIGAYCMLNTPPSSSSVPINSALSRSSTSSFAV